VFKDELRDKVWNEIRQHDLRSFGGQLTAAVFAEAAQRAKVRIGISALNLVNLVWLSISSAMHRSASFAFVLTTTLKLLEDQSSFYGTPLGKEKKKAQQRATRKKKKKGGKKSKHHPHRNDPTQLSEEAFAQARQRMPLGFWVELLTVLAERFQQDHRQHLNFRGFRLLALDGTTLKLQNEKRLRDHYGRPKNGRRKKAAPQARMVMLTLPTVRIPIAYELSPLADSELVLAGRLMRHVQSNDLLLMDRGFISYGLFWQIQHRGAYFGTRMRKALKLKTTRRLGYKDRLVEWTPSDSRGQWKQLPRSIPLRVIDYQIRGFRPSALVTNVLDAKRLPRDEWVRLAIDCDEKGKLKPGLYHRRWEIETTYFELKITLQLQSLRSRTPASLQYELAGCVVYYLLVRWLIVLAAEKHGLDPLRISFTNAVRELEQMRSTMIISPLGWVLHVLLPRLLDRIASHTVAARPGRHYPRPNDTKAKDRGKGSKQLASKLSKSVNSNHKNNQRKHRRKA
jgi:Transposase DDE domain